MKFSLIMATIGRYEETRRFLEALKKQTYPHYELIVVDQSATDEIEKLCDTYRECMSISHIRSERFGISFARNQGLKIANGDVLGFPDDDCEYPENLLYTVTKYFDQYPGIHGLTGCVQDKQTGLPVAGRFAKTQGFVTIRNLWCKHISVSMFLKNSVIEEVGEFDEDFGLGAEYGSGEETDLLLRALKSGFSMFYTPDIVVYHPDPLRVIDAHTINRAYKYGLGAGALFRKHVCHHGNWKLVPQVISQTARPLAGSLIYRFLNPNRSRYYIQSCKGKVAGFLRYRNNRERLSLFQPHPEKLDQ